jgi:hypothetical protein
VLRDEQKQPRAIEISRYFEENPGSIDEWWFTRLPKEERQHTPPFRVPHFHHTLSRWVEMICAAGMVIEQFGEPSASDEIVQCYPMLADTQIAGMFLHVRIAKPLALR